MQEPSLPIRGIEWGAWAPSVLQFDEQSLSSIPQKWRRKITTRSETDRERHTMAREFSRVLHFPAKTPWNPNPKSLTLSTSVFPPNSRTCHNEFLTRVHFQAIETPPATQHDQHKPTSTKMSPTSTQQMLGDNSQEFSRKEGKVQCKGSPKFVHVMHFYYHFVDLLIHNLRPFYCQMF